MVAPGRRWSQIAERLQCMALEGGYGLLTELIGHGIGRQVTASARLVLDHRGSARIGAAADALGHAAAGDVACAAGRKAVEETGLIEALRAQRERGGLVVEA